jgi:CubicO group peptidase (beta-lactamase class C family)
VLFAPLGIRSPTWQCDPDGNPFGYGHLRLAARDLARLGQLWLDRGAPLVDPAFFAEMTRPQSAGGPPENLPYGFLIWLDEGVAVTARASTLSGSSACSAITRPASVRTRWRPDRWTSATPSADSSEVRCWETAPGV